VRWRLAAVIAVTAVTAVTAAVLGALQISSDVSNVVASGRDQHLARLNTAVVKLTQDLEDERDLTAGYAARREAGPVAVRVAKARRATDAAARTVRADAAGVGPGYQPSTVQDLDAVLAGLTDLGTVRTELSSRARSAAQVIRVYTYNLIVPANTFSAAAADDTSDTRLQRTVTTVAALLRVENEQSVQRAIVYAALSSQSPVLAPDDRTSLLQSTAQEQAELAAFNRSADQADQQLYSTTVSGAAVDDAASHEIQAEQAPAAGPPAPLTGKLGLDAATWYGDISTTIGDTRMVADRLAGQVTVRADALRSNATRSLLLTSIVTVLFLALLISAVLAGSMARPPGRLRSDTLGAVTL
jgi:hypothetical protein